MFKVLDTKSETDARAHASRTTKYLRRKRIPTIISKKFSKKDERNI